MAIDLKAQLKEHNAILDALTNWLASQNIDPALGAHVMATLSGAVIGRMSNDHEHLTMGISLLQEQVERTALGAYLDREKKKT